MSRFKPYYTKDAKIYLETRPGQALKRHYSLEDQERDMIRAARDRFIDLFGLTLWEECSMVTNAAEFKEFCEKHQLY